MAISVKDVDAVEDRMWRTHEAKCVEALRSGVPERDVDEMRQQFWRKMQAERKHQYYDLDDVPMFPQPSWELEREKKRQATQLEAAKKARVEHMQSAAMVCSITDGLNLWVARWGDGWVLVVDVQKASIETDAFRWDVLQTRLTRTIKIETDGEYVRVVT